MATIKAVVRNARADGFLPVYIRIVHKSKPGYIKTDKIVSPKEIAKSGDIIDPVVNEYCAKAILRYFDMLNRVDSHNWSVRDVINYLTAEIDEMFAFVAVRYNSFSKAEKLRLASIAGVRPVGYFNFTINQNNHVAELVERQDIPE